MKMLLKPIFFLIAIVSFLNAIGAYNLYHLLKTGGVPYHSNDLTIVNIAPGSAAELAGIKPGDSPIEINGEIITDNKSFYSLEKRAFHTVPALIKIKRGTEIKEMVLPIKSNRGGVGGELGIVVSYDFFQKKSLPQILIFHFTHLWFDNDLPYQSTPRALQPIINPASVLMRRRIFFYASFICMFLALKRKK